MDAGVPTALPRGVHAATKARGGAADRPTEFGEARFRHRVTHAATGPRARATAEVKASDIVKKEPELRLGRSESFWLVTRGRGRGCDEDGKVPRDFGHSFV